LKIVRSIADFRYPAPGSVGLVPTMGAFHEGHLSLMRHARQFHDQVVVSLFVNPTQFGENEDFAKYPRDLTRDAALAAEEGVDIILAPTLSEIYPRKLGSTIHVPEVTSRWEGEIRPGHFDGVATIVAKLFNIVRPEIAYFGQKDLQQTIVVRRMVSDLNMPLAIEVLPTARESDGLAMSSRNAYLSTEERSIAPGIYRELTRCRNFLQTTDATGTEVEDVLRRSRSSLEALGFRVDYFEWIDAESMEPVRQKNGATALIAAAGLGRTRLIDNVLV
jgi:pantoate--beta-alanine ligase